LALTLGLRQFVVSTSFCKRGQKGFKVNINDEAAKQIGCKKVSFANEFFANAYIEKLQKTSARKLKPIRAYLCENCLNWHLTSIIGFEQERYNNLERQINNLKSKIEHLENENRGLKSKFLKRR